MKNWKTTAVASLLAALVALNEFLLKGTDIADFKAWIIPVAIAALGILAKDFDK